MVMFEPIVCDGAVLDCIILYRFGFFSCVYPLLFRLYSQTSVTILVTFLLI